MKRLGIACALVVTIFSCANRNETILKKLASDFPVMDGSTTTQVVSRKIACMVYGVETIWTEPQPEALQRTLVPVEDTDPEKAKFIAAIKHNTTHQAYLNVVDGTVDCALIARLPSPDEIAYAEEKGVKLECVPVALDAFVFLAHVDNPLDSLTLDQIRDVYTGKVKTWDQLGVTIASDESGPQLITAYQRERNSGSQELMNSLVLPQDKLIDAPQLIVLTMLGPFNAIGGDLWGKDGNRLGFGYTVYFYMTSIFPHKRVKMIGVNGVHPNYETIANRTYPLTAEVYSVIRADIPKGHRGRLVRDWLLTKEGQLAVTSCGYVGITPAR